MAGVIANATASLTRDFQGQGLMLVMRTTAIRRLSPFPGTLKPARVETRQGVEYRYGSRRGVAHNISERF